MFKISRFIFVSFCFVCNAYCESGFNVNYWVDKINSSASLLELEYYCWEAKGALSDYYVYKKKIRNETANKTELKLFHKCGEINDLALLELEQEEKKCEDTEGEWKNDECICKKKYVYDKMSGCVRASDAFTEAKEKIQQLEVELKKKLSELEKMQNNNGC